VPDTETYGALPATAATAVVRGYRRARTPSWGSGADVNYADASLSESQQAYFGANAANLARIRASYDPNGFFTQPQDF
jgi:hypothetical protein